MAEYCKLRRGLCQERCFNLLQFLIQPRTIKDICEHLEITHRAAQNWIDSASLYWPVVEVGKLETAKGKRPVLYQLTMKLVANEVYNAI